MSIKRIKCFKNGFNTESQELVLPNSMEALFSEIYLRLHFVPKRLFLPDGTEIKDVCYLRNNDVVHASNGEDFIKPPNISKISEWITLNVGGKYFTTTRSTLTSKEPTSMLACMFSNNFMPSNVDMKGAYLIDRSPKYFEPIINYLRSGSLIYNKTINPEGILEEAKFYGINSLIPVLEKHIQSEKISKDDQPLTRRDVIEALIRSPCTELRFQGVNLAGADLSRLDLRHINFKYANLQGCKLTGTNLSWSCFERADLSYTNIDGAQMLGVKGSCANLEGASMINCNFNDSCGTRSVMEGVNLKSANLEGSDLCGVNLRVATLKNANLQNCDLRGAVLAGADLEKCDLSGSDLYEANLRGANLKDAALELMLTPLHMAQAIR